MHQLQDEGFYGEEHRRSRDGPDDFQDGVEFGGGGGGFVEGGDAAFGADAVRDEGAAFAGDVGNVLAVLGLEVDGAGFGFQRPDEMTGGVVVNFTF